MDFQDEELKEILNIFRIESEEIVERLNNTLLNLEKNPADKDLITLLFRDAHSLKGAARMIGFSNTQNLAHKIEDILGLAKDNQLQMNANIADTIYKAVDLISKIITDSIETGTEVVSAKDVTIQLSLLENVTLVQHSVQEQDNVEAELEFNKDYLVQNIDRINYLTVNILLNIVSLTENIKTDYISNIFDDTSELIEHFQKINYFEIKNELEQIKLKLEVILKCNTELTNKEVNDLQKRADNLLTHLSALCKNNGIEQIDYYSYAFEGKSYEKGVEKVSQETSNVQIVSEIPTENLRDVPEQKLNFESLNNKLASLSKTTEHISELLTKFEQFQELYPKSTILPLLDKIISLFKFIKKNDIKLDESQLEILVNCSNYCFKSINNENPTDDVELLIQQLTVAQQLIELANPVVEEVKEVTTKEKTLTKKSETKKSKKSEKDFSKLLNSGEIKTLHVESSKLDTMVNQIGELISTKIKTSKHLSEFLILEKGLEEWQKDFTKLVQHIKNYDKKSSQFDFKLVDSSSAIFIKQFINSLSEQNKKLNVIVAQLSQLQRSGLEDDMKMRVLIDDFDAMIKNIRILPLATVFHLFGRMVRDIAKESGKEVELLITGSDTSADKKIIEEIKNPLIQIIRNSVDHGIESPERRQALGKNPTGLIQINAKHQENNILIEVIDDGRGFDIEQIKAKAISKGYLSEEEALTIPDKEVLNIIFLPGFTTDDEVTNISGRGIGMDIVKSKIAQLNGTVNVISEFNKGTKIQINLPVTMATMTAFLVQASSQTFAIPMSVINTIVCKRKEEFLHNNDVLSILHDGKNIPLYNLSDLLNLERIEKTSTLRTILIIETNNKTIGIVVDKLLGEQEILQKRLEPPLYRLKNISGITTLASGETCLILNALDLMKNATLSNSKKFSATKQSAIADKKDDLIKDKKVLIVDDSQIIRTLCKNILTNVGFAVELSSNTKDALRILAEKKFDIVVTDIEMPEMDGFDFLTQLKSNPQISNIPVIIMSSYAEDSVKTKADTIGAEYFITKEDFNQNMFIEKIKSTLLKYI